MRRLRPPTLALFALLVCASCGEAPPTAAAAATAAPPATTATSAAAKPAAAPEKPNLLSDQWYRTIDDGQPSGWRHVRWTRSTYEGKPSIHDRTESYSSTTRQMG